MQWNSSYVSQDADGVKYKEVHLRICVKFKNTSQVMTASCPAKDPIHPSCCESDVRHHLASETIDGSSLPLEGIDNIQ